MNWMNAFADLATIITALVAGSAYGYSYLWTIRRRQIELKNLLATKYGPNDDSLTIHQAAIQLKATDEQIIEAASRCRGIEGWPGASGNEYRLRLKRQ